MNSKAFFAWEGFSFYHPEDWAPITLSGDRREGYVRLQGSGRVGCQVRWKQAKDGSKLEFALQRYFQLLQRDAKRNKALFKTEVHEEHGVYSYRWQSSAQGRGRLLWSGQRVFFLEVTGGKTDSILPYSKQLSETFACQFNGEMEPWALFGMRVRLPLGLSPHKRVLQAGRTSLQFNPKGAKIEVTRFGFGSQLIEKHGIEAWAKASLGMLGAEVIEAEIGLELKEKRSAYALAKYDEAQNQIVTIRSITKQPKWIPTWDWLLLNEL